MTDVDDWDDDPGYDQPEPDWDPDCLRCNDSGRQYPWQLFGLARRYRSGRGTCPACNPSPRQKRRAARRNAWELRRFQRQSGYQPAGANPFGDEAPF
jgi:hypothetical protein